MPMRVFEIPNPEDEKETLRVVSAETVLDTMAQYELTIASPYELLWQLKQDFIECMTIQQQKEEKAAEEKAAKKEKEPEPPKPPAA